MPYRPGSCIVPDARVPFAKQIAPVWETEGGTRRIVSFNALLNNDLLLVRSSAITSQLFDAYVDTDYDKFIRQFQLGYSFW